MLKELDLSQPRLLNNSTMNGKIKINKKDNKIKLG